MGWICHICDSYNKEKDNQCFVCGQGRLTVAAVSKPVHQRKKHDRHGEICNRICRVCKGVFFTGVSVAMLAVVIALISKVVTGSLGDIGVCAAKCFEKIDPEWLKIGLVILLGGF